MLKVITELEKLGLELTDEQKESVKKNIGEEVYSKGEFEKKVRRKQRMNAISTRPAQRLQKRP